MVTLEDWSLYDQRSLEWFDLWVASGYNQLPFLGSWMDQPSQLIADFKTLMRVRRFHQLNEARPSIDDLAHLHLQ